MQTPDVNGFFDSTTNTISYVVSDPHTKRCAVIDSVLDYDPSSGRTSTANADRLIDYVEQQGLTVDWVIDTHVHADHVTAAPYIKRKLGGLIGIGDQITHVQKVFGDVFNEGQSFPTDGSQFDVLFADGDTYKIGNIEGKAIHTPGHTPACMSHLIGDALFVGDTIFMEDYGTARCDFPGGDSRALYHSVQKLYALPDETRVFLCHDYLGEDRTEYAWETTLANQKASNIHLKGDTSEEEFVAMRNQRDENLSMPRLIIPSVQLNMRAGHMPEPETNGTRYLKVPLDRL